MLHGPKRLAQLEHGRWNVERLAAGWTAGKETKKNIEKRTNPNITRWERLDEQARNKDRDLVRRYPEVLKHAGYRIAKDGVKPIGRPLAMSVKVLIRNDEGKYLAIRRSQYSKHNAGKWDLPGGKVDPGENFVTALQREVQEETGLVIRPTRLAGSTQSEAPSKIVVYLILCADLVRGEIKISKEHTDAQWSTREEMAKLDFCEQFEAIVQDPQVFEEA